MHLRMIGFNPSPVDFMNIYGPRVSGLNLISDTFHFLLLWKARWEQLILRFFAAVKLMFQAEAKW